MKIFSFLGQSIVSALVKLGLKKKAEADVSRADSVEKTLKTVGESLDVEKKVREAQDAVDDKPSDVEDGDGGLNFDGFNKGE